MVKIKSTIVLLMIVLFFIVGMIFVFIYVQMQKEDRYGEDVDQPESLAEFSSVRKTMNLNGEWMFSTEGTDYPHKVIVPNFLKDIDWWIYDGTDFEEEYHRVRSYGYDPKNMTKGWYKKIIHLPEDYGDKHLELQFDGIAMYSEITVNGNKLSSSWGMWKSHRLDITEHAHFGGENEIAVYVEVNEGPDTYSHGPFARLGRKAVSNALGIWESVRLVVTDKVKIDDVFFKPNITGAAIDVTVENSNSAEESISIHHTIISKADRSILFDEEQNWTISLPGGSEETLSTQIQNIQPRLWTPEEPNLYILKTRIEKDGIVLDEVVHQVGFRTFEVVGNKFYLNGKPYWIRGAGHVPVNLVGIEKTPQIRQIMQLMHDGNQMSARLHNGPGVKAWYTAADEIGVSLNVEGIRNWALVTRTAPPAQKYLDEWFEGMADVIKRLRNHPSIFLWTTGNEMLQGDHHDMDKWKIMSDLNKLIRETDPTRPIVASSEYVRGKDFYTNHLKPANIDDGDVDDAHIYPGWYNPSPFAADFHYNNGRFQPNPDRPFISAEMSTGYLDHQSGLVWRYYKNNLKIPHAWIGQHADGYDLALFLEHHRINTKELAEKLRRTRDKHFTAGYWLFANLTWFKDFFSAEEIKPFPVYDGVKMAYAPVLASLEHMGRNFYAGDRFQSEVAVINDDIVSGNLKNITLEYRIIDQDGNHLTETGKVEIPELPYFETVRTNISLTIPSSFNGLRIKGYIELAVKKEGDSLSVNRYDIHLAKKKYVKLDEEVKGQVIWLYDKNNMTSSSLDFLALNYIKAKGLNTLHESKPDMLIIGKDSVDSEVLNADLDLYVSNGGKVLVLEGGSKTAELFPNDIEKVEQWDGEVVTGTAGLLSIFKEMQPMDMRWWRHENGGKHYVTNRVYKLNTNSSLLVRYGEYTRYNWPGTKPSYEERTGHTIFAKKLSPEGKGYYLVSDMLTSTAAPVDPLAGKLLANLLKGPEEDSF
jgi:beta-galactosidase